MDRLASMEVFVKAADSGSFAAAAATLGLSSQMVGKHVRALEERLGARLLNRTTRRQSLTEVGRAFYERCKLVLAEAEAADALAAGRRMAIHWHRRRSHLAGWQPPFDQQWPGAAIRRA